MSDTSTAEPSVIVQVMTGLTPATPDPYAEGGQPGVIVHIPPVFDPVTNDPIPLHIDATITVTGPAGLAMTFNRVADNVLTSSVGYNLYIPESTEPPP